ncbi:MAG: hypothetical protein ACXWCM_00965 [Acidimicrobiales bacterium]
MRSPHAGPTVSRRALLGGAAATVGLLTIAGAGACSSSSRSAADDPLATLGRGLARGPDGARLKAAPPDGLHAPIADQAALLAGLAALDATIRADFAEGRTVLADGWLLSDTEAAALVAYARG